MLGPRVKVKFKYKQAARATCHFLLIFFNQGDDHVGPLGDIGETAVRPLATGDIVGAGAEGDQSVLHPHAVHVPVSDDGAAGVSSAGAPVRSLFGANDKGQA